MAETTRIPDQRGGIYDEFEGNKYYFIHSEGNIEFQNYVPLSILIKVVIKEFGISGDVLENIDIYAFTNAGRHQQIAAVIKK